MTSAASDTDSLATLATLALSLHRDCADMLARSDALHAGSPALRPTNVEHLPGDGTRLTFGDGSQLHY